MDSRYSPHWEFCVQALTLRVSLALLGLWAQLGLESAAFFGALAEAIVRRSAELGEPQ